jgi:DNA-binding transcriptional regulator YdaS (Cro superfamily)
MRTSDVIDYFGSKSAVAVALEISPSAVSQWGEIVPPLSAVEIERASKGRLKFDPKLYKNWNRRKPH